MEKTNNLIVVDSKDRVSGNSSNFVWNLPSIHDKNFNSIAIQSIEMINSFLQINDYNNTIIIDEGGGNLTATLTQRNDYTQTSLCAEIKTQLEAVGALTYTVSTVSNKMTISATGNFDLVLSGLEICDIIGFNKDNTSYTGLATYTATNFVSLNSAIDLIYVDIKEVSNIVHTTNFSHTFVIQNNVNNMDYINFTSNAYYQMHVSDIKSWKNWTIKLNDRQNRPITLGTDWNFKVEFKIL